MMSDNRKRRPVDLLPLSDLFKGLEPAELDTLAGRCEIHEYKVGSFILQESPVSGCVYIIDSGELVISRREDESDAIVARFISGECFGELDLFSDTGGAVTIRAETDTRLLRFPGNGAGAGEIFMQNPTAGSQILKNLLSMVAKRIRSTNNLISKRSPWIQELRKLVFVDKLTGLYNRTWLTEELEKELTGKRAGTAILIIKPDNFKVINDTYGHDAGDKTLSLLASTVLPAAGQSGSTARHGGDVFAVVHKNANARQSLSLANRILTCIRKIDLKAVTGTGDLMLTASIGIMARRPGDRTSITKIIDTAFERMLIARNSGGDTICDSGGDNA